MIKEKLKVLSYTSLGHFINDGYNLLYPVLITYYIEIGGLKLWILGVIAIIYTLISGFVSTPASLYADRNGKHKEMLILGIIMDGIAAPFLSLPFLFHGFSYEFMIIGALFLGIGQSLYHPMGAYILSDAFEGSDAPSAMGINGSFGSLGRAFMPSMVVLSIMLFGKFYGVNFLGIVAILAGIIINMGLSVKNHERNKIPKIKKKSSLRDLGKFKYFIVALVSVTFFRSMFLSATTTYVPTYVTSILNSHYLMGIILTLALLTAVIGQPFFGYVTSKKGGRFTVTVTVTASTAIFFVFLLAKNNIWIAAISYSIYVFFAMSGFPVLLGYVTQVVPKEFSTTSSGFVWGIGNTIGGAAGIGLMSLLNAMGYTIYYSFWIMMITSVISCLLLPLLPKRTKLPSISSV
ncbi:MAG: MFS transporter [Thermoplasmata archaeon]